MWTILQSGRYDIALILLATFAFALTLHEFAHAVVADKLGDDTPRRDGKLTISPFVHLDVFGFLMLIVAGFGWATPIRTNPAKLRHNVYAPLLIAIAGPLMNLLIAFVTVNFFSYGSAQGWIGPAAAYILFFTVQINLMLFFINMLPIGVLDGHHILPYFLPKKMARQYRYYNERYGQYALLSILFLWLVGLPVLGWIQAASGLMADAMMIL